MFTPAEVPDSTLADLKDTTDALAKLVSRTRIVCSVTATQQQMRHFRQTP